MTIELKEKTINGHVYKGTYIPASKALPLSYKMTMAVSDPNFEGDVEASMAKLIMAGDVGFLLEILEYVTRDGEAINKSSFDKFYTHNLVELGGALAFTMEANFSDFLPESDIGNSRTYLKPSPKKKTAKKNKKAK